MRTGLGFVVQKLFKMLKLDRKQLTDVHRSRFCGSKTFSNVKIGQAAIN
jgi:hypothetical protein